MNLLFISMLCGALGAGLVMKIGPLMGINDIPNHRSSHTKIIPKGGGIGILAALMVMAWPAELPFWFWLPCLVISLVSLMGDRVEIPPRIRLIIHFLSGLVFLAGFWFSKDLGLVLGVICLLPLLLFMVGTANFYNFMDGIDGIAGITGLTGFGLVAVYSRFQGGFEPWGLTSMGLAGACAGFLLFNFPRAKVFMGDVGSILLGFGFACMALLVSESLLDFLVVTGFLFPFYADELVTIWVRLNNGESLLVAHRKHVYQLLANELRIPHWKVSLGYGTAQLVIGLMMMTAKPFGWGDVLLVYLGSGVFSLGFAFFVHQKAQSL